MMIRTSVVCLGTAVTLWMASIHGHYVLIHWLTKSDLCRRVLLLTTVEVESAERGPDTENELETGNQPATGSRWKPEAEGERSGQLTADSY